MSWNGILKSIADVFESSFTILPKLGNLPNVIFILALFGAFVYWLMQLNKFKRNAIKNGGEE